jgi:hypothetical protein|nr:MAG TPA: hypothetical protein [Caudoviricetes sp.]
MDIWNYHDTKMQELKQLYNKISKQTQNRLQEIFDTFNFTTENIYNIADNKTKKRINTYIEQWKEQGLLKNNNYFTVLANNIYKRTRVKNSEILELLIYSAYIEEQSKLEEQEKQIMYEDANYYYEQGQQEVNKKKKPSILMMALFLALLDQPNYSGFNWKQYIEATIQYNTQQIYKQAILNIQQQKGLEIDSNEFQTIINRQNNQKLNINNDKISGAADLQMIGLNNLAKVEGIKEVTEDNSKVRFIAVEDDKTTLMCDSLNNQEFYINKENVFDRYYGENQKELKIQRIRCNGLVLGLNLPPIQYHFHYCRSTIMYLPLVEKQEKTEYNLDIPKISKDIKQVLSDTKLNPNVKRLFDKYLTSNNAKIDNNLNVPMRYNINDDKIYINPNHSDFKYYDLSESLTHEIIHMIDIRNNISNKLNVDNELRRARLQIDVDEDKYINMLSSSKYEDNMTLSDIFSAITNGKISGNYMHSSKYWIKDSTRIEKELSANIMSAYLNKNQDTLNIIDSINGLKQIKEKVVKLYNDYTR